MSRFFSAFLLCLMLCVVIPAAVQAEEVVLPGDLIKASGPAVYYYYGNRYAFPNEAVFHSWYADFSAVKTVSDDFLASLPLAGNVRFRPGVRMVKLTTDPKVYFVSNAHTLRWISTEAQAISLYGDDWALEVRDLNDAFFADYEMGEPLTVEESARVQDALPASYVTYEGHIDAVGEAMTTFVPFVNPLQHAPSLTFSTPQTDEGYDGFSVQSRAATKVTIEGLFTGWQQHADTDLIAAATTTFGNIMSFTQPQSSSFTVHRSIGIVSEDEDGSVDLEGATNVDVNEVVLPVDALVHPGTVIQRHREGGGITYTAGIATVSGDEMQDWLVSTAATQGWVLAGEKQEVSSFGAVTRQWFFTQSESGQWIVIQHVTDSFIQLFFGEIYAASVVRVIPRL